MPKPTYAQEQYAEGLLKRLREESQFEAERYGRLVMRCEDRQQMSRLIDDMKAALEEIDAADRWVRQGHYDA